MYSLDPLSFKKRRGKLPLTEKQTKLYKNPDEDTRGPWQSISLLAQGFRPNQMYTIVAPNGKCHVPPDGTCWKVIEKELKRLMADNRIYFGKDGNGVPRRKLFLSEAEGLVPWTWWPHDEVGHTDEAAREVRALFGTQTAFSTPKPVRLLDRILRIATNPGDLVLDFFAGSGTTAHAVLRMNAEKPDEPPRRFILVSNTEATADEPEKNLCRDVCRQRVANLISGYGDTPGAGGSFAYLRTKRIPMNRVVRRIDHGQVWLQLQLTHFASWSPAPPLASERLFLRADDGQAVGYLTALSAAVLKRAAKELEGHADATLYTWQPEAVAAHFEDTGVTILPIPQTLIDRFGLKR